eukprot:TRINITY_DN17546_c0_g1_i1.p1 TRINITY_DN17546_c0_g1~~TRINITY_DN17546_c0_g1_i1.p1  ORF type:complete len:258 (+),score=47.96 TRINITY_DN17546_c0_g1_i1:54-776(+)
MAVISALRFYFVLCVAHAALPPGYEDVLFCPKGYCRRPKETPRGFVGPASAFHECAPIASASDGADPKPVTPWGSNHGDERRQALEEQGFHTTLCSEVSGQEEGSEESSRGGGSDDDSEPAKIPGSKGSLGPAHTRGEMEPPAEERDMGGWTARVYSEEQQARLGVNEWGNPSSETVQERLEEESSFGTYWVFVVLALVVLGVAYRSFGAGTSGSGAPQLDAAELRKRRMEAFSGKEKST